MDGKKNEREMGGYVRDGVAKKRREMAGQVGENGEAKNERDGWLSWREWGG